MAESRNRACKSDALNDKTVVKVSVSSAPTLLRNRVFTHRGFLDTVGGSQNRLSADINPTNRFLNPGRLAGMDPHSPIETGTIPLPGDDAMGSLQLNAC